MSVFKNSTALVKDATDFIIPLDPIKNCTVSMQTDAANGGATVVRLDGSMDGVTWTTGISLSDPATTIGAAYLTGLTGASKSGQSQDRCFGFSKVRVVRTDADASLLCTVRVSVTMN